MLKNPISWTILQYKNIISYIWNGATNDIFQRPFAPVWIVPKHDANMMCYRAYWKLFVPMLVMNVRVVSHYYYENDVLCTNMMCYKANFYLFKCLFLILYHWTDAWSTFYPLGVTKNKATVQESRTASALNLENK